MRIESFATVLKEASTLNALLGNSPSGDFIVKALHRSYGLAHDANYHSIDKLSWTEIKASTTWILFKCSQGTAALKSDGSGRYKILARPNKAKSPEVLNPHTGEVTGAFHNTDKDGVLTFSDTHGGRILAWIEDQVGKIRQIFISHAPEPIAKKDARKELRKPSQKVATGSLGSAEGLAKKFAPLLSRIATQAIADVKGMISQQLKVGNYTSVKRRIDSLIDLEKIANNVHMMKLSTLFDTSVKLAAAHLYPEETKIHSHSNSSSYGYTVTLTDEKPYRKIYSELSQGNTQALGTILSFFKQVILHL